jgi:GTP pyrophosphokinase/guanosine-3',5'-bis(diphosphate) 3'-pyrophosphohydrolase
LGIIHRRWRSIPGRFKDYISQPKSNGYRSLHTTVSGRDGKRVEVQIRTHQMHDVAEDGVAAHWSYRDGVRSNNPFAVDPAKWVAGLKERFEQAEDHDEFLEAVKLEMYSDQVFCFTPKGDVFKLPRGATPIDFAYAIHTRIGSACVGAKIDGLRVPLWTRLKNGQSVEIITAEGQKPEATWMEIAQTGKARSAIRRALREEDTERYIKLGQELARVGFEHIGKRATDKALTTAAKTMGLGGRDTLLAQLGAAQITARDVIQVLFPELAKKTGEIVEGSRAVVGLRADQAFRRAGCCAPLPGERIVGITTLGEGVKIHAIDCNTLTQLTDDDSDRWVDLHWHEGPHAAIYGATIELTISNDAGVLGRLCTLIGERGANISNITFEERTPDFYRLIIDVELRDVGHMHAVCTALEADTSVAHIARMRDDNSTRKGAKGEVAGNMVR